MKSDRMVPDWLLERLHRNELPEQEARTLRARLAEDGETGRLEALAASDREILESYPPARVAAEIRRRAEAEGAPVSSWQVLSGRLPRLALGAVGGVAVLVLITRLGGPASETGAPSLPGTASGEAAPEYIGLRGLRPHLVLYRKGPDLADRLSDSATVRPGDKLQLAYVAVDQRYGVIASVDARGTVTLHWPERPGPAAPLLTGEETPLPAGFELDDTPGFEKFFFFTANEPFDTARVIAGLTPTGPRPLPPAFSVSHLTLKKK